MKTVLRNDEGKITHVHLTGNQYVTPDDHKVITETPITKDMLSKFNKNYLLQALLNGEREIFLTRKAVLVMNGYTFNNEKFI